mmetsp:Transcript_1048/g.1493  ORF Transcript_1048/g.1493 Transcript_1048/m.1493 type:complete len:684 (-) Transcript_1048:78-2129(-)
MSSDDHLHSILIVSGVATALLGSSLAFVLLRRRKKVEEIVEEEIVEEEEVLDLNEYPGGYINILFGSQTGTAIEFGKEIENEGKESGFKVRLLDLEDIPHTKEGIKDSIKSVHGQRAKAVFLMATYGEGEPTDNARPFVDKLNEIYSSRDEDPSNTTFLADVDFAVFGLGNTDYEHYNAMGKFMDNILPKFGAKRVVNIGLGDDNEDIEGDFQTWKDETFWPAMKKSYLSAESSIGKANGTDAKELQNGNPKFPKCPFEVEFLDQNNTSEETKFDAGEINSFTKHYFTAVDCPITGRRELRSPDDGGSTLHIEIDISKASGNLNYQTADNLAVLPVNDDEVVNEVATALGYDLDAVFCVKASPSGGKNFKHIFPVPCTVREFLQRYCDLTMAPRRSELKVLANFASNAIDRSALLRMASKEGKKEYKEKVIDAHIGIVDIITKHCQSIQIPLEHFINICPRLQPRYYTISSSSSVHPTSVHITVAVLKQKRSDGSIYKGICSNHLSGIKLNGTCRVFCRDSTFRLPSDVRKPIILIGPGTGIAPMRALLQERSYQKQNLNQPVGETVLYFGCKNSKQDYLYEDELAAFQKEGTLTALHVAFSREQAEKVYVQHLLRKNASETWDMIHNREAHIYVCGGTKMGSDTVQTLLQIFEMVGGKSVEEAKTYLKMLESKKRIVQELWS